MSALKNLRHEQFAQFLVNGDSTQRAYELAYGPSKGADASGRRLLRNALICERLRELQAIKGAKHAEVTGKAIENAGIDKEWVMRNLREVAERCMQAVPVLDMQGKQLMIETPAGEVAAAYTFNSKSAVAALIPLGKELGMFVDRKEIRHGKLEDLNDEQLNQLITEMAKEAGVQVTH